MLNIISTLKLIVFWPNIQRNTIVCSAYITHENINSLEFAIIEKIKQHGELGSIVGKLEKNILIIDDVISAGLSVLESIEIIREEVESPWELYCTQRMERSINEVGRG